MTIEDLCEEGITGLTTAIKKYVPSKARLSTYASHWIMQSITRAIADLKSHVRVPVHAQEDFNKMTRVVNDFWQKNSREPTDEELMELTGFDQFVMDRMRKVRRVLYVHSLDMPSVREGDDDYSILDNPNSLQNHDDTIKPLWSESSSDIGQANVSKEEIHKILKKNLSPRQYEVLCLRFGLNGHKKWTLDEIAQKYGLTRERIRQIESSALRIIRLRASGHLRTFLN